MSDEYGIKPEWKESLKWAQFPSVDYGKLDCDRLSSLHDLSAHLLKGWMRERFRREHKVTRPYQARWCSGCDYESKALNANVDPRHDYDDAAWAQAARDWLGGKSDG